LGDGAELHFVGTQFTAIAGAHFVAITARALHALKTDYVYISDAPEDGALLHA
jgi:hypothetical protein